MKKVLCLVMVLFFFVTAGSLSAEDKNVLAKVDGKIITIDEFNRKLDELPIVYQTLTKTKEGKEEYLTILIQNILLANEAKRLKIDKRKDVADKIEDTVRTILAQVLIKDVFNKIEVKDEEIKEHYNSQKEQFKVPEQVNASHILLKFPANPTDDVKKAVRKKGEEILEKIKNGEDFKELVMRYSDDTASKEKGGNIGYFSSGMLVKEFEDAAFKLKAGEVSSLVETEYGYHIIKVEDKKPGTQLEFEDVKGDIKKKLIEDKKQLVFEKFVADLEKKSKIFKNTDMLKGDSN